MMSPTHKRRLLVNTASGSLTEGSLTSSGKHKKGGGGERSVMSPFKKRSSMKHETLKIDASRRNEAPATPTHYGNRKPSLTKSSSAFFPNLPVIESGTRSPQKSVGRSAVGGLKGIWKRNSRKKTSLRTETEDWVDVGGASAQSPVRELPRRLSLRRKNSLSGDKVRFNTS